MIAAGLPFQALSPWGREAQSIAFFNTPDTDQLYSGVTNRIAFTSRIRLFNSATLAGGFCSSSWLNGGMPSSSKRFDSCVFRRKLGCSPRRRDCMIRAADCRRYRGYELVSSFAIPSLEEFQLLVTGHTLHVTAYQAVALMPVRLGPKAGHFL